MTALIKTVNSVNPVIGPKVTDSEINGVYTHNYTAGQLSETDEILEPVVESDPPSANIRVTPRSYLIETERIDPEVPHKKLKHKINIVLTNGTTYPTVAVPENTSGSNKVGAVIIRVFQSVISGETPNNEGSNVGEPQYMEGTSTSPLSDGEIQTAIGSDFFLRIADVTAPDGFTQILDANIDNVVEKCELTTHGIDNNGEKITNVGEAIDPEDAVPKSQLDATVASSAFGIGDLKLHAGTVEPTDWLVCDGRSLDTTTYGILYNIIGYSYGGSGSLFNLPNLKGRLPMGANSGTGYDTTQPLTVVGTYQEDQIQGHHHDLISYDSDNVGSVWGMTNNVVRKLVQDQPLTTHPYSVDHMTDMITDGINGVPREGTYTRPKNVSINYFIKYQ